MEYKKTNNGTYNLSIIKTTKFKLCHMEIIFHNNLSVKDITKRNVLFEVLSETCKKYQTKRDLKLKLEDLYNAKVYTINNKVGNGFITNFCVDFLSPTYSDKNILKEVIDLLSEMIFKPNVTNHEFNEKEVALAKKKIADEIKALKENPNKLACFKAISLLSPSNRSYNGIGSLEDLDDITSENLYDYYLELLDNDYIDIYLVGDIDDKFASSYIDKKFNFDVIKNHEVNLYCKEEKTKLITKSEEHNNIQTNLVVLLNLMNLTDYEKKYVAIIYNIILGAGLLNSKLYQKLRGENSLCYSVNSDYLKYNNLIMINTSIDVNSLDLAVKLIKDALKEMKNNISLDEINNAKELINSSLNMYYDNPGKIVDNEFFKDLKLVDDLELRIKTFKNVTVEEIYALAKKIDICVIYALEGKTNE